MSGHKVYVTLKDNIEPNVTCFFSLDTLGDIASRHQPFSNSCYRRYVYPLCVRFRDPRQQPVVSQPICNHHQPRSEEHTSELQSRQYLVCRLLLEKKTKTK